MKTNALAKTYDGKRVLALPPLDFEPGKIYAVIGANGSGKSTFARLLAGIIRPDGGQKPFAGKAGVGYMPQNSFAFRMKTRSNILLACRKTDEDLKKAARLMSSLKLDSLADRKAGRLSGGETARMAMARLLMCDYDVVILDEPTAAMDVETTVLAENLLLACRQETGCVMILVTHSLKQAERVADEVLFLSEGELVEKGPAAQVLHDPKKPKTKQFLDFYGL
jgi:ABC-type multidrug transport system ATPase subunit